MCRDGAGPRRDLFDVARIMSTSIHFRDPELTMSSQPLAPQGERLFRYLFEQASLGIAVENIEGKVLLANPALCSMLGYQPNELCGMHCSEFSNREDSADDWALFQKLRDGAIDHYSIEKRYIRKDGGHLWGRLNISLLKSIDHGDAMVFAFVEDITDRKDTEEALSTMSRKLIQAQDDERTKIARELHDDIGQRVALLAAHIEQVAEDSRASPSSESDRLQDLRKQANEIAMGVQALSHELHSPKLEYLGIVAAMRSWCKEFSERDRMEIDFKSHDVHNSPPREVSLCLFRVLQEALHNAARHSGVKRVEVALWGRSDQIHLTIGDSGRGFEITTALQGQGLGLTSMQERIRLVNGTIAIQSSPMAGTRIDIRVPLPSADSFRERATG